MLARVRLARGDVKGALAESREAGAREWARQALEARRRYDAPGAPSTQEAESAVKAAG